MLRVRPKKTESVLDLQNSMKTHVRGYNEVVRLSLKTLFNRIFANVKDSITNISVLLEPFFCGNKEARRDVSARVFGIQTLPKSSLEVSQHAGCCPSSPRAYLKDFEGWFREWLS